MSGLFGSSAPSTPEAPPAPTVDDAAAAGEAEKDALRRRRGMASTIYAGAQPATAQPTTQTTQLLGS